ncbi:MAG: DNA repair protein RecO [Pseudohongiellaceae bacterium]
MENRIYLQPAYILHKQHFRNTSYLIDFFCLEYGRVRAVARGARREKSRYRSLLELFHPLLVSFSGRGELKTVSSVESSVSAIRLTGERLFSGLYLNELITRMLLANVEHRQVFQQYQETLLGLQADDDVNMLLRRFELSLLEELGYGVNLQQDWRHQVPIKPEGRYLFVPDLGVEEITAMEVRETAVNEFLGQHLIDLERLQFRDSNSIKAGRRLLRLAIGSHLGEKPLHSRSLFSRFNDSDPRDPAL